MTIRTKTRMKSRFKRVNLLIKPDDFVFLYFDKVSILSIRSLRGMLTNMLIYLEENMEVTFTNFLSKIGEFSYYIGYRIIY